jgi:hypothetical protein
MARVPGAMRRETGGVEIMVGLRDVGLEGNHRTFN